MNSPQIIPELHYSENGEWFPLPEWAYFYLNLGLACSEWESPEKRLVVVLAVPTRAYAAALTAFGLVIGDSLAFYEDFEIEEHLQRLVSLPRRTPVFFRRKERQLKGTYIGSRKFGNKLWLGIKLERGTQHWISAEQASRIRIAPAGKVRIPKHQRGRRITRSNEFLTDVLGEACADDLLSRSKLMCTVVGRVSLLQCEIVETPFATEHTNAGTLNDVLRVRRFVSASSTFRSDILAADRETNVQTASNFTAAAVIFDGASGFLKWHGYWGNTNWIVVLDRTGRNFDAAVALANQQYIQYRVGDEVPITVPAIPSGVEAMVYEEIRR